MSMTDSIADLLTRIRNAHIAKHDRVSVPASNLKLAICRILEREGYLEGFSVEGEKKRALDIRLRYDSQGQPAILRLRRVSRPGRRVYLGARELRPVLNGMGTSIVSTSRGLLTDREAREQGLGGEILCEIQ